MLMNAYARFPVTFTEGKGAYLFSQSGDKYLDCVSGIAVNCLGHAHPSMILAAETQSRKLFHISNLYHNEPQNLLGEKLIKNSQHEKVFFCNSGTEANELAIKIMRKYGKSISPNKTKILYMTDSFHGRSTGSLAITGQIKYQKDFTPLMSDVIECPFNDSHAANQLLDESFCGIILEPIQGESGIKSASIEFLNTLKALCEKYKILLTFDEIQCGMGRTGSLFAYEQLPVIPDVVTIAKALGGGVPIGACLTRGIANEVIHPGDHGSTYGGNPFATSISLAVLTELIDNDVIKGVKEKHEYVIKQLNPLLETFSDFIEIRGKGLLLGLKFSDKVDTKAVVNAAFDHKLLLVGAGDNVVRFLPPLNIELSVIDEMVEKLKMALQEVL